METSDPNQSEFDERRQKAREVVNQLDADSTHTQPERNAFFNMVYDSAGEDEAQIPWADLKPKPELKQWLNDHAALDNSQGIKRAIDIGCGLGDNAEAISKLGYDTIAFDIAPTAIDWAKKRFPDTKVDYQVANLFEIPNHWIGRFHLVNECYTLQALPPKMIPKLAAVIASLVAPGGDLLVYSRMRTRIEEPEGPPWPLHETDLMIFAKLGFELFHDERFEIMRNVNTTDESGAVKRIQRSIPHQFAQWRKL